MRIVLAMLTTIASLCLLSACSQPATSQDQYMSVSSPAHNSQQHNAQTTAATMISPVAH